MVAMTGTMAALTVGALVVQLLLVPRARYARVALLG
jgi:hypothetical protein